MARIAFLGTGQMGSGMVANLLAAGHQVRIWNRSPDKAERLVSMGAVVAPSPAAAAADAEAIFSSVADDAASERVWLAEDGALTSASSGALVIECSTISHDFVRRLSNAAIARGCRYLDCPVNGTPANAVAAELVLLIGASDGVLDQARPVLESISKLILHFGDIGTGTAFKLINNLLGAVHIASIAEAVHLAQKLNLNTETLIAAVESGPCASPHVKRMIRPMAEGRQAEPFGLAIGLREKDSRYCLNMAKALETGMSVGDAAYGWYQLASQSIGDQDDSAVLEVVAENDGVLTPK